MLKLGKDSNGGMPSVCSDPTPRINAAAKWVEAGGIGVLGPTSAKAQANLSENMPGKEYADLPLGSGIFAQADDGFFRGATASGGGANKTALPGFDNVGMEGEFTILEAGGA